MIVKRIITESKGISLQVQIHNIDEQFVLHCLVNNMLKKTIPLAETTISNAEVEAKAWIDSMSSLHG